nr:hypothetical protein [Paraliobacillus sp. X-1268]
MITLINIIIGIILASCKQSVIYLFS